MENKDIFANKLNDLCSDTVKFEKLKIHDDLFIIRDVAKKHVIGYINKHPENKHWFWFMGGTISDEFNNFDDAVGDLTQTFVTYKMNKVATKIGTINKPNLTLY